MKPFLTGQKEHYLKESLQPMKLFIEALKDFGRK
jgi:hypothetical protein